jgi:hypothetical protein
MVYFLFAKCHYTLSIIIFLKQIVLLFIVIFQEFDKSISEFGMDFIYCNRNADFKAYSSQYKSFLIKCQVLRVYRLYYTMKLKL